MSDDPGGGPGDPPHARRRVDRGGGTCGIRETLVVRTEPAWPSPDSDAVSLQ